MAITERAQPRPRAERQAVAAPSVLAVVVTHRGRKWLKECLVALNQQSYPLLDVLVVDDASPDYRVQPHLRRIVKRHVKRRWAYLRTPRPLGFGGAINWALARVRTAAPLLLFLHDDAALDRTAIERMVTRLIGEEGTAIVGPKVVSWDDPTRLEEIGMAADRFGYPYKGLEEGEIDLGQHDGVGEVFFVSSTCMLVRQNVFRQLRGFDPRMRAFAEDLDICWRARLAGHQVRVEPQARVRHAIALAKGLRGSPFVPARYFIRRNRLRTVAKNASSLRLIGLIPQFVLLTLAEMVGFIVLRQPAEILNLARALGWNFASFPQTLAERARVQRRRRIPDRRLRRYTIPEIRRLRVYASQQAERLEEVWGRRAELVALSAVGVRRMRARMLGWPAGVAFLCAIALVVGFRHFLWAPPAAVGELLPYPERLTALWRAVLSPWLPVGLGEPAPAPPALALLGLVPFLSFGTAAAQKLLILGLGLAAFVGAYKLVSDLVDRPARYAAGLAYALGGVGYAGLRQGQLAALVFGAVAPFMLLVLLRLTGWVRPPGWVRSRAVARVALAAAVSAAFVPGSLILYALAAVLLAAARATLDRASKTLRGLGAALVGLAFGWVLLLPWSGAWLAAGGPLARLWSDGSREAFQSGFVGHGMTSVVLGQTPDVPALFGLALPLLGLAAVAIGAGQRRRLALAFWTIVLAVGWVTTLISSGSLPPPVASATELGVLAAASFAALVGLAVGSVRLDLPRRSLGLAHALALGSVAVSLFLVASGIVPALWHGEWVPDPGDRRAATEVVGDVRSILEAEATEVGAFRALWVGEGWSTPAPSVARAGGGVMLTGPRGPLLGDLFERSEGAAAAQLDRAIASVEEGATDRAGALLAAFNVEFVVLEKGDRAEEQWLKQRDLAVSRSEEYFWLLQNEHALPRAGVYEAVPSFVRALAANEPRLLAEKTPQSAVEVDQISAHRYRSDEDVATPGVAFLAEANHDGWQASVGGRELARVDGGWGNAFAVPEGAQGELVVAFPRSPLYVVSLLIVLLLWGIAVAAAFSAGHKQPVGRPRGV